MRQAHDAVIRGSDGKEQKNANYWDQRLFAD
jgi:hypothetical protein